MIPLKISIITPNYNYDNYIGYTIQSILDQTYDNIEHIIVDDGSTDQSVEVISEYIKRYPQKIKLIQQKNKGQTSAINVGFMAATGDILGWINSDDTYCKDVIKEVAQFFMQNHKIDFIYGDINIINENGDLIRKKRYLNFSYTTGCIMGFGNLLANNSVFWRKELNQKIGYLNEKLRYVMDVEYWYRITKVAKMKKLNITIGNYRQHNKTKTYTEVEKFLLEQKPILIESYNSLWISKIFPYRYIKPLRMFYILKNKLLKLVIYRTL